MVTQPQINNWYLDVLHNLFKVRLLCDTTALIEYLDGTTKVVQLKDWEEIAYDRNKR